MYRLVRTTTGRIGFATYDHTRYILKKAWRKKTVLESLHRFHDNIQRETQLGTVLTWNSPESFTAKTDAKGFKTTIVFSIERSLF